MTDAAMMLSLPKRAMKCGFHWNWSLGLALAVLPIASGLQQESFSQPLSTNSAVQAAAASKEAAAPTRGVPVASTAEPAGEDELVNAPANPISTVKPLPPGVKVKGPVAEVLKLADSGVEESVMLAFVTNSTSTFSLGAEEIIYLNDIGVPSAVVAAMIQRDQALREVSANMAQAPAAPELVAQAPSAPEPAPAPAPEEMAPQPDYTGGGYPPAADNSYASFYEPLAPYGTWVDVAGYGPCWQPSVVIVNPGWQPYCNGGHWVYTDCGWYWMSGYSWGWAPFHYGRWFCHNNYGWCWAPGNVWGPSWVCWRYSGSYCGWAPLPPAARFSAGVGLTYRGQRVNGGFGFGLSASSYTFVPANRFSDRHLNRYAVPHQQVAQVYQQTVPSGTIFGNSTRVVNRGIPVSRVEAATHTQIPTLGIREVQTAGAGGARGERLEASSQTLSVFRPQLPRSTGAQPASDARPRPDVRPVSGSAVVTPGPAGQRMAPASAPRPVGGSPAVQPNSSGGSGRRSDRSAYQANAVPMSVTGPALPSARGAGGAAPRLGEPLILRGPDRSGEAAGGNGATTFHQAGSPNSLVVRGNGRGSSWQAPSLSYAPVTEDQPSGSTASRQDFFSRPAGTQRSQPLMTAEADVRAPTQPSESAPRANERQVHSERPWQYTAPPYQGPARPPPNAPAPSYSPPRAQSYSPPAPSPVPRPEPTVSQPVHSAPSAPAPAAPAAHVQSSPGKYGR